MSKRLRRTSTSMAADTSDTKLIKVSSSGDDAGDDCVDGEIATEAGTPTRSGSAKWRCESCTLLNPVQVSQCLACFAWKLNGVSIVIDADDTSTDKDVHEEDGVSNHDSGDVTESPITDDVIVIDADKVTAEADTGMISVLICLHKC